MCVVVHCLKMTPFPKRTMNHGTKYCEWSVGPRGGGGGGEHSGKLMEGRGPGNAGSRRAGGWGKF